MLTRDRTRLRPFHEDDLETLVALRNDVALQASLLALPRGSSIDRVRAWATQAASDPTTLFFIVAGEPSGHALGFVQLTRMDPVHRRGDLGIALTPEARGKGYGSDAIRLLEAHARDVFAIRKIGLQVLASNTGAARLYERLDYARVGVQREHFYHRGAFHDVALMEKLLPDAHREQP